MSELRAAKRLEAMRRCQAAALEMFVRDGFEEVTVEQVAAAAGVSPISIYRWFGSKERLVLWDEYDPPLFERIGLLLDDMPPIAAIHAALRSELGRIYETDRDRVLTRTKLAIGEPALRRAVADDLRAMADGLAQLVERRLPAFEAKVISAAVVGSLEVMLREWARSEATTPLAELIDAGFAVLERSTWSTA